MIKWMRVQNFKNLADVEAEFNPLNVIIGSNGAGKSSLLQAIDFLKAVFYPSIDSYLQEKEINYADLPNLRQSGKHMKWHLIVELPKDQHNGSEGKYEYMITVRRWRYLGVGQEKLVYRDNHGNEKVLLDRDGTKIHTFYGKKEQADTTEIAKVMRLPCSYLSNISEKFKAQYPEVFHFRDWVMSFRSFLIWDPKVLRKKDRGKHTELGTSGEHLAPVLANIKRNNRQQFEKIVNKVKSLFPTVSGIEIKGSQGWGWQEIFLTEAGNRRAIFNSEQMSDGILRLLAISTFLYSEKAPGVLTFEEPENGIHPQLVGQVINMLRVLTLKKPPNNCQVFFTTHSPYILDQFIESPEEVYVMERGRPQQGARLIRLSENSNVQAIKDTFKNALGEAWYSGLIGGTAKGRT